MAVDLFGQPVPQKPLPKSKKKTAPPTPPPTVQSRPEPEPRPQPPQRYRVHRASGKPLWFLLGGVVLLIGVQALGVPLKKIPGLDIDLTGVARTKILGVFALMVVGLGVWYFADIVAAALANVGLNRRRKTLYRTVGYRRAVAMRVAAIAVALFMCLACVGVVVRFNYWEMRSVVTAMRDFFDNPPPSPLDPPPVPKKKSAAPESDWEKFWRENFGIKPAKP
jgi:hypothetical protein